MWIAVLRVFQEHLVHIGGCILKQFVGIVENDQSDFAVAQNTQLVCLLHETKLAFGERHLKVNVSNNGYFLLAPIINILHFHIYNIYSISQYRYITNLIIYNNQIILLK